MLSLYICYPHCSDGLAHLGSVLRRGLLLAPSRFLRSASSRIQVRIAERRAFLLVSFQFLYSTLFDLDPCFPCFSPVRWTPIGVGKAVFRWFLFTTACRNLVGSFQIWCLVEQIGWSLTCHCSFCLLHFLLEVFVFL
jgi:hypothetical protein